MRVLWLLRLAVKRLIVLVGLGARFVESCNRCGRRQPIVWHAPDALWFRVTGSKHDVLCPACFRRAAKKLGIYLRWAAEESKIPCAGCGDMESLAALGQCSACGRLFCCGCADPMEDERRLVCEKCEEERLRKCDAGFPTEFAKSVMDIYGVPPEEATP